MTFNLEFETTGSLFTQGGGLQRETARVLRDVAERIKRGEQGGFIRDEHNETIGGFAFNTNVKATT